MGPLAGVRVVELGSIGPGPWCAMMLSDMGAEVIRVDRPEDVLRYDRKSPSYELGYLRGRRSVAIDLKHADGLSTALQLIEQADVVIEGSRPGVAERLGVGPEECLERNPRLVYGRMTGWGQDGPLAQSPGHDLNYLALTGLLDAIGTSEHPVPPLNLVGDYGGGGMLLAFGVVCGVFEARNSGRGQVIDAAMVDGAALLGSLFYTLQQRGAWSPERGTNRLDGGSPFYRTYRTSDDRWVSVAANEPQFFTVLVDALGIPRDELPEQHDVSGWDVMAARFAEVFLTRTRDEWTKILQPLDACFAPVLTLDEAPRHEHSVARGAFVEVGGLTQPAPAPRFGRTPGAVSRPAALPGEHTVEVLTDWGFDDAEVATLVDSEAVVQRGGA